jgi:hypothetical protein
MGKSTRFAIDYQYGNVGAVTASQPQKFKDAAHELDCDLDERRWEERLRKVAKQKLASESSASSSRK